MIWEDLVTHSPCVASPVRKPTREAQGSADQSMKKPILASLILHYEPLKALMLVASTARWSSWFHLLITRLEIWVALQSMTSGCQCQSRQRKRYTEFSSQTLLRRLELDLFYLNLIRLLVRTACSTVPHVTFPMTSDGPSASTVSAQRLIVRNIVHFVY